MPEFICSICDKSFKTIRGLRNHQTKLHNAVEGSVPQAVEKLREVVWHSCTLCSKKYKTANGLRKHSALHTSNDAPVPEPPATPDTAATVVHSIDEAGPYMTEEIRDEIEERETEETYFFENDAEEEDFLRSLETFGPPLKKTKTSLVTCNSCGKKYGSVETYIRHRVTHAMEDLYKKAPNEENLKEKTPLLVRAALQEMVNYSSKYSQGFSKCVEKTARFLLGNMDLPGWLNIVERIATGLYSFFYVCDKFLTPSELREAFQKSSSAYSVAENERKELLYMLNAVTELSTDSAHMFLGSFIRRFASQFLAFFIHNLIPNSDSAQLYVSLSERFVIDTQPTDTLDFKQTIHYIGGSNVRSILRVALRVKNHSNEWLRVVQAIKRYLLAGEFASAPDAELMAWTVEQNRGGLIIISDNLLNFLIEVAGAVKLLEHLDGSLYISEVMEKVSSSSKLICLWDEVLKGSIPKDESLKLLHALCSHFCNTWRTGIIRRRIDQMSASGASVGAKHGQGGVQFRATL